MDHRRPGKTKHGGDAKPRKGSFSTGSFKALESPLLANLYKTAVESIICLNMRVWDGSCMKQDRKDSVQLKQERGLWEVLSQIWTQFMLTVSRRRPAALLLPPPTQMANFLSLCLLEEGIGS